MRRAVAAAVLAGFGLVPAASSATRPTFELRLSATPSVVVVGLPVRVEARGFRVTRRADGSCCTRTPTDARSLQTEAIGPDGKRVRIGMRRASRGVASGSVRLNTAGRWHVQLVRWPSKRGRPSVSILVNPAPTTPPSEFGPLGASGCRPPSPRNQLATDFAQNEVFGTSTNSSFWGLLFIPVGASWASSSTATLSGLAGKEIKIVFKLDELPSDFYAVGPDGSRAAPVWGPNVHGSSNWARPGAEWGAGFVFAAPGCWEIHAAHGTTSGDMWLDFH